MLNRSGMTTLSLLLAAQGSACGPRPDCDAPACSWQQVAGKTLTVGEAATLQVRFNPDLRGLVTQGHEVIQLELSPPAGKSPPQELSFAQVTSDPATYEYHLTDSQLDTSWIGSAQLAFPPETGEHQSLTPAFFPVDIQKATPVAVTPIVYTDSDSDGFPYPIRILPSKWKNPSPSATEDQPIVLSLHRSSNNTQAQRKIKVLQYSAERLLFDTKRQPNGYEKELAYASPPRDVSWGELSPTLISAGNGVLLTNPHGTDNYGVLHCDYGETDFNSCDQKIQTPDFLSAGTLAFTGIDLPQGRLLARSNSTGMLRTLLLKRSNQLITANSWNLFSNTPPEKDYRVLISLGALVKIDKQTLLVAYQDPKSQILKSVTLYPLDADAKPSDLKNTNLSRLLLGQQVEALAVGDVNQDMRSDIVIASNGVLYFLMSSGDGQFQLYPHQRKLPSNTQVSSIALGDMDGDGKADVIVAQEMAKQVLIYLNQN